MAEVLSILELSAWQTSVTGTELYKVSYEASPHLSPVEKSIGVLSVVSATS